MLTFTVETDAFTQRLQGTAQAMLDRGGRAVQATAKDVWSDVVRSTPIDQGDLRRSWTVPRQQGSPLRWTFGTDKPYATMLEYGGYRRVGPRTVQSTGGDLGAGFAAAPGIYSKQAPLGFVRKALATHCPTFRTRTLEAMHQAWGTGQTATGWPGTATAPLAESTDLGALFGIELVGNMAHGGLSPHVQRTVHSVLRQVRSTRRRRRT